MVPGYESVFGLVERPFSLTPDPRWFFAECSHGRALESVLAALGRGEPVVLVTGDLGVGKTLFGRALVWRLRPSTPVSFIANPLVTPEGLVRMLWLDLGVGAAESDAPPVSSDALRLMVSTRSGNAAGVLVLDDAERLPSAVRELLVDLTTPDPGHDRAFQVVLCGQPPAHTALALGSGLDERLRTRVRLASLTRDECAAYVAHRLRLAGASTAPTFSARALDVLFSLSNGLPRLINLLCERAVQEAAAHQHHTIEPSHIAAAASELKLTHARPRRFRWFSRKVS
jgi:general secretion pathway protein A